jgi:hypothetical protein
MHDAIKDTIDEFGKKRAAEAASWGKMVLDGGGSECCVVYDIPARRVILNATVEVTQQEEIEETWRPDEDLRL